MGKELSILSSVSSAFREQCLEGTAEFRPLMKVQLCATCSRYSLAKGTNELWQLDLWAPTVTMNDLTAICLKLTNAAFSQLDRLKLVNVFLFFFILSRKS